MEGKKVYQVTLSNHEDTVHYLVEQDVWDWIKSPFPEFKGEFQEDIVPAPLAERLKEAGTESVRLAKWNPMAWRLAGISELAIDNGEECNAFYTTKEVIDFTKKNKLTIADEIEGLMI
jgi:hypothetical protein